MPIHNLRLVLRVYIRQGQSYDSSNRVICPQRACSLYSVFAGIECFVQKDAVMHVARDRRVFGRQSQAKTVPRSVRGQSCDLERSRKKKSGARYGCDYEYPNALKKHNIIT